MTLSESQLGQQLLALQRRLLAMQQQINAASAVGVVLSTIVTPPSAGTAFVDIYLRTLSGAAPTYPVLMECWLSDDTGGLLTSTPADSFSADAANEFVEEDTGIRWIFFVPAGAGHVRAEIQYAGNHNWRLFAAVGGRVAFTDGMNFATGAPGDWDGAHWFGPYWFGDRWY